MYLIFSHQPCHQDQPAGGPQRWPAHQLWLRDIQSSQIFPLLQVSSLQCHVELWHEGGQGGRDQHHHHELQHPQLHDPLHLHRGAGRWLAGPWYPGYDHCVWYVRPARLDGAPQEGSGIKLYSYFYFSKVFSIWYPRIVILYITLLFVQNISSSPVSSCIK